MYTCSIHHTSVRRPKLVFFFRVLHTIFPHLRVHAFTRSVTMARSSAVQASSVDGRRGGGPSSVAPRSRNPSADLLITRTADPCAQSVKGSPTEPVISRSSRQRLGHLQSHFHGGWHVWQAVFPELQSAASCSRIERRDCDQN